jgi:hypothetical protein
MTEANNKYVQAAEQISSVLASTVHIAPIWRAKTVGGRLYALISEWTGLLEQGTNVEDIVNRVLVRLWNLDDEFERAWATLNDGQRLSCLNALRNIIAEVMPPVS